MSFLDKIPSSWTRNFKQRSRGDPRPFIHDENTKTALWASQDVYNGNTRSSRGNWTQVASRPFQPSGSGRIVAALGGGDLRFKVYQNNNDLMISFIGTQNLTGVWQDAQLFQPIQADYVVPGAQGKLHSGFAAIYQAAKPELQKILSQYPTSNVIFTGHSLGGAVASIASSDQWPGHRVRAITVGAPQIGDEKFASWYKSSGFHQDRIIQKSDPITIGNLKYVHADEAAWVIGDSNKWVDMKSHGIDRYIDASESVHGQLYSDDNDLIYREANAFVHSVELARDVRRAYKYYQAAEEFYEFTQVASGLPVTAETFRNIVLTQDGALARSFETTLDKLSQYSFPSRQEFRDIFINRIGEVQAEAAAVARAGFEVGKIGKYVDVTDLTTSGLADIAPDILRPLSNMDVLADTTKASTELVPLLSTEQTILTPLQLALQGASKSSSNYFKLITDSDTFLAARKTIQSGTQAVTDLARPVTSSLTNIYASTEGVRNWVSKTLPKAASVGGFILNALSFGTGVADIVHGDKSAETIASTTFAGIGAVVAGIEAGVAVGLLSSSLLTASIGAGITIPVVGQIAAVAGLLTFGIAAALRKKPSAKSIIHDTLIEIANQAIDAKIDIGIGTGTAEDFYERNKDLVYVNAKDKVIMRDGGQLIDLIYAPVVLADGTKIHANDPQSYQQAKTAETAYDRLQEAGISTGTKIQFVSDHYKDFRYQTAEEQVASRATSIVEFTKRLGERATGHERAVPVEKPDDLILYQGKPFQDHFLPTMTYKGETILPSKNPRLYAQIQIANQVYDSLYQFNLGDRDEFVNTYATEFEYNNGQIEIDGQDFRDAIFQPIEGVSYSQNPGAYESIALTKFLYDGLVEKGLSTGGLSQTEFIGNYFTHIDLDSQGNLLLDGKDASEYPFDPIEDLNGRVFFRFTDPEAYDKVQAFYEIHDKLNDDYKNATGRLLNPQDLWNELSPTMKVLSGNQVAFGMTPDEMMHPQNQLYLLQQTEQRAISLGIPLNQKKMADMFRVVELANFQGTQGNGFSLDKSENVLFQGSPLLNQMADTFVFNGKVFDYNAAPREYINALQYKNDRQYNLGIVPKFMIKIIMDKTLNQTRLPSNALADYTGYLTKALGPIDFTPPEPAVLKYELGQMEDGPRKAYAEYKADLDRQNQVIRDQRQEDFSTSDVPMEKPEPALRAADRIYQQLVSAGVPVPMDQNQFSQLYAPHITFDRNGAILINNQPSIPRPQPVEYNGNLIYQVSDPELYQQVRVADAVFQELLSRGQMTTKDRNQFLDQYKGQFAVGETGDISFQGKTIGGQVAPPPSIGIDGVNNQLMEKPPETFPNPFQDIRPTPHGGAQPDPKDVVLPTPEQQSIMNPLTTTDTKINQMSKPLSILDAPQEEEARADAGGPTALADLQQLRIPGGIGFVPTGQQLRASLQNHLWTIYFENGETGTYPRQRDLNGYVLMGNWTGSTPLANGGPVNVLDSYAMAYHVQKKYGENLAAEFFKKRILLAIQMKTIATHIDVREFELAQQIVQLSPNQDIFMMEATDRQSSHNLGARLQEKYSEVLDQRETPVALPQKLDMSLLMKIPKLGPQDNPLKRSIEAAGILGDSMVQNKLRRVYSEYASYLNFSKGYMDQIEQAQQGVVLPSLQRNVLEGIISKDPIVESIVDEWMSLLQKPVSWYFQHVK